MLTPPSVILLVLDLIGRLFGKASRGKKSASPQPTYEAPVTSVIIMLGLLVALLVGVWLSRR